MIFEEILAELSSRKCKLTSQRKEILKVLVRARTHLSAKEVFERLRKVFPNLSFDTVYRNLTTLEELNIIDRLDFGDGRSRYELNRKHGHHHHMVCLRCGGTWEIAGCPMEHVAMDNEGPQNFKITGHRFELFGLCRDCQGK